MSETLYARHLLFYAALLCLAQYPLPAAIIGTNSPALALTRERVATLPRERQAAWNEYLKRSNRQRQADQAVLEKELRRWTLQHPILPPSGRAASSIPLEKPAAWYAQPDARRLADNILSFQTPAGGWSKNLDFSQHPRAPGEHFAPDNGSRYLRAMDNDQPLDERWHYVGTFDNDATVTQLYYLAKVIAALKPNAAAPYRTAFLRGLDYILAAQYPNGGWPQVWPLEGGYHDAITFNDDAMINLLNLLSGIAEAQPEFSFVPAKLRARAKASLQQGIHCVLAAQIVVGGRRTVWGQQYDPLTLQPCAARNYEMPAFSSAESARIMMFLMALPSPDAAVVAVVDGAAAWFEKTQIHGFAFKDPDGNGRRLVASPGDGLLWARYYQIGTDRPIFGDRDKTIHDSLDEISKERRNGYGWYRNTPAEALARYYSWAENHAAKEPHAQRTAP
jgi:PelA/Pel-15E family pectate lyase